MIQERARAVLDRFELREESGELLDLIALHRDKRLDRLLALAVVGQSVIAAVQVESRGLEVPSDLQGGDTG